MELEEAIAHLKDYIETHNFACDGCKAEHEQLLAFLLELQERRERKDALYSMSEKVPILYRGNGANDNEKIIGSTTGYSCRFYFDQENNAYVVNVDGVVFFGGTECLGRHNQGI